DGLGRVGAQLLRERGSPSAHAAGAPPNPVDAEQDIEARPDDRGEPHESDPADGRSDVGLVEDDVRRHGQRETDVQDADDKSPYLRRQTLASGAGSAAM